MMDLAVASQTNHAQQPYAGLSRLGGDCCLIGQMLLLLRRCCRKPMQRLNPFGPAQGQGLPKIACSSQSEPGSANQGPQMAT